MLSEQDVERAVYLTSIASESVIGQEKRHAFILNKLQMSEKYPVNFTREHYKTAPQEAPF